MELTPDHGEVQLPQDVFEFNEGDTPGDLLNSNEQYVVEQVDEIPVEIWRRLNQEALKMGGYGYNLFLDGYNRKETAWLFSGKEPAERFRDLIANLGYETQVKELAVLWKERTGQDYKGATGID